MIKRKETFKNMIFVMLYKASYQPSKIFYEVRKSKNTVTSLLKREARDGITCRTFTFIRCIPVDNPSNFKDVTPEDWLNKKGEYKKL